MPKMNYPYNPVPITFEELRTKNSERMERSEEIGRILRVDIEDNYCMVKYSDKRKETKIEEAVMNIYNGTFPPVSNPSFFKLWHGFKKN